LGRAARLIRHARVLAFAALAPLAQAIGAPADLPGAPADGWVRWQVEQVAGSGEACCFGADGQRGCRLDARDRARSMTLSDIAGAAPGRLQVFARLENGQARAVHAFGAACPVRVDGEVRDLAGVGEALSAAWLAARV